MKLYPTTIRHLVLSGGGPTGLCFYGALKETNLRGFWDIKNIQTIYGTSVGTVVGVFISLGYNWEVLDDYIIKRPWNKLFTLDLQTIVNSISNRGIFNEQLFYKLFSPLLKGKDLPININLLDFYNYNKIDMHFICTELNHFRIEDISHKTHPNMKLLDAVYASCSVPVVFAPYLYRSDPEDTSSYKTYLDGGVFMNYPFNACVDCGFNIDEIFGIYKEKIPPTEMVGTNGTKENLLEYLFQLIKKMLTYIEQPLTKESLAAPHHLPIKYDFNTVDINEIIKTSSSEEERIRLIFIGKESALRFLDGYSLVPSTDLSQKIEK